MIRMSHVSKWYQREVAALADINLHVGKGEFLCLTGPSGAGKTTLLRLIFGAERATEGQVAVDGRNISRLRRRAIALLRRSIGVVFQDFKLIQDRTVAQNVAVTLEILGLPRSVIEAKVAATLRRVALEGKADVVPMRLSGGEQQRVAIARALVNDPKILLADEPTGNLDPDLTLGILDLLKDINTRGTTVILATHDRKTAAQVARREMVLKGGRIVQS
jgi:cell division transport system ATP-binding protein